MYFRRKNLPLEEKKQRISRSSKPHKGFTLIEMIITVIIVSVGIITVVRSFLTVTGALQYIENKTYALEIIDDSMINIHKAILTENEISEAIAEIDNQDLRFGFNQKIEIFPIVENDQEIEGIKRLEMTVKWRESNKEKRQKLYSYIFYEDKEQKD